jgi:fermentation-respiration switch protein FrsA (DUF1100 family)
MEEVMQGVASVAAVAAGGYALLCAWLFFFQSQLIYFPTRAIEATPAAIGLAYESVEFRAEDGVRLTGWYLPACAPEGDKACRSRATLLFFHGNAGNISHRLESLAIFHGLGLDVFIFDYRGYGESEGSPDEQGTYRDAEAAWRYLAETRRVPSGQIVYFGRSLGAAVAAWLAARRAPGALILESTFTSAPDLGADLYPWLPVRWLARIDYDTRARLSSVTAPVLIAHSPQDEIIPFRHAQQLFAAAREPKELLRLRGDHNSGFYVTGRDYIAGLDAFLRRAGF